PRGCARSRRAHSRAGPADPSRPWLGSAAASEVRPRVIDRAAPSPCLPAPAVNGQVVLPLLRLPHRMGRTRPTVRPPARLGPDATNLVGPVRRPPPLPASPGPVADPALGAADAPSRSRLRSGRPT